MISSVAVIGGGRMGGEIAALCASKGFPTFVKEVNAELALQAEKKIRGSFQRWLDRGSITQEQSDDYNQCLVVTDVFANLPDTDLVIEAIVEKIEDKKVLFATLDRCMSGDTIFASNTSALSITEMAGVTNRQGKFAGAHFFNPATKMMLLELIRGEKTEDATMNTLLEFAKTIGKVPVLAKDSPGFIVNRLLIIYVNAAVKALMETRLLPEQIDAEAKKDGWRMGPFEMADMVGLQTAALVVEHMYRSYGERFNPTPLLAKMMELKRFGNPGFYGIPSIAEIIEQNFPFARQQELAPEAAYGYMMQALTNEAFMLLEEGVASVEDIEKAALYGIGFPRDPEKQDVGGPLHYAAKRWPGARTGVIG